MSKVALCQHPIDNIMAHDCRFRDTPRDILGTMVLTGDTASSRVAGLAAVTSFCGPEPLGGKAALKPNEVNSLICCDSCLPGSFGSV